MMQSSRKTAGCFLEAVELRIRKIDFSSCFARAFGYAVPAWVCSDPDKLSRAELRYRLLAIRRTRMTILDLTQNPSTLVACPARMSGLQARLAIAKVAFHCFRTRRGVLGGHGIYASARSLAVVLGWVK